MNGAHVYLKKTGCCAATHAQEKGRSPPQQPHKLHSSKP